MNKIQDLINQNKRIIGIWGYPDPEVLNKIQGQYAGHEFVDLDINFGAVSSNVVPDAYCKIITNIIDNAVALKEKTDLIIASVGEEKCDSARIAARILEDLGFEIIQTRYDKYNDAIAPTPIATSNLPLKEKITIMMDCVIKPVNVGLQQCEATMGFWGVPPNDLSLLELFPDTTHVFGWTRCVEAKRPADLELEMLVDESIPTVFFAQTFCAKMQLAKYLARKHNGLFVDVDDLASNSVRAKIEAFIRLG
ncbi:MAG: hypothetical protein A2255_01850 [Candidatus Melainabacteria bacterium RIFOXYA2_FULL_32_9]|nr:MAG: hypothetical protein A2255_01850 [Candidatus Melainabacteria bacterium RIFOXYA2_FULL_32_9]